MNSNLGYSPETPNLGQIRRFFSRVSLKFDVWPWKPIRHLFYAISSFVHHFVAIGEFKLELQSGNSQFGSKSTFFSRVTSQFDVWPWKTIGHLSLATYMHHFIIICGVVLCWVVTTVTLTFDFWPWPFAWTLLCSLVITPENFMMIRWWEHSEKGVTDGRTDGQTENTIH